MLDISKRVHFSNARVVQVYQVLGKLPADMKIFFNGNAEGFLHVSPKGNFCCFDESDLAESYDEQDVALGKLMEAMADFALACNWSDNDYISALENLGVTREDFEKHGKGEFVKDYYE